MMIRLHKTQIQFNNAILCAVYRIFKTIELRITGTYGTPPVLNPPF